MEEEQKEKFGNLKNNIYDLVELCTKCIVRRSIIFLNKFIYDWNI